MCTAAAPGAATLQADLAGLWAAAAATFSGSPPVAMDLDAVNELAAAVLAVSQAGHAALLGPLGPLLRQVRRVLPTPAARPLPRPADRCTGVWRRRIRPPAR